jgi:hypothetical protein
MFQNLTNLDFKTLTSVSVEVFICRFLVVGIVVVVVVVFLDNDAEENDLGSESVTN